MLRASGVGLLLALAACGENPRTAHLRDAVRTSVDDAQTETAVAFRFPARRAGDVRLYQLPELDEVTWRFETPTLVTRRIVGFDGDDDLVWVVDANGRLVALDLNTGRARTADSGITVAALGPMGMPLYARGDTALAALSGRAPEMWARTGGTAPQAVAGMARNDLLVVTGAEGARELVVIPGPQGEARRRPLPDGAVAISRWGDALAVATDSGVVVVDPLRETDDRFLGLDSAPAGIGFSPSAHRLYVVTAEGRLLEIERFSLDILSTRTLGPRAGAIRADPTGRVVLVRSDTTGVWVVPVQRDTVPTRIPAAWDPDLPAVAPDGTLLLRRGDDVIALDLDDLSERGRVRGGAADRWLPARWDPRRPALQVAVREAGAPSTPDPDQRVFVQVSSTTNPAWAEDLARDLRVAGVRASVLPPEGFEEMYRVVVGPFGTRQEAETAGRQLGMPFWIFTQER